MPALFPGLFGFGFLPFPGFVLGGGGGEEGGGGGLGGGEGEGGGGGLAGDATAATALATFNRPPLETLPARLDKASTLANNADFN